MDTVPDERVVPVHPSGADSRVLCRDGVRHGAAVPYANTAHPIAFRMLPGLENAVRGPDQLAAEQEAVTDF